MNSYMGLEPVTRDALILLKEYAEAAGLQVTVTSTFRSAVQQAALYRRRAQQRAAGLDVLPAAPPGRSQHEYGLAFDMVENRGRTRELVQLAQALGLTWAGPKDPVHFQVIPQALWSRILRLHGL